MRRNFNRRNYNNKFSGKGFVGNQSVNVPDAPYYESKDMTNKSDYNNRNKSRFDNQVKFDTVFQKVRSYDLVLDKAEVKIAGASPIYGKLNPLKEWNFGHDAKGTFTASLNQMYFDDEFFTLYSIDRNAIFNYKGCDYLQGTTSDVNPALNQVQDSIAMRVEREGAAQILFELEAARTFDMAISNLTPNAQYGDFYNISTPMMTVLQQYQHELFLYVLYLASFDRLRAALPLLQSLDFNNNTLYAMVDDRLKRSAFTGPIKNIKSTLKRRWVDAGWIKDIILPFMVWSKKTDGLNSPILSLNAALATPITEFTLSSAQGAQAYRIPQWGITASHVGHVVTRNLNYFDLGDLITAIVVPQTIQDKRQQVEAWINAQLTQLNDIQARFIDWTNNDLVIAVEAMLSKLSTRPGSQGMTWQQNVSPNELSTFESFTDWEIVNSLVLNVNTLPEMNQNGFEIRLPMYQYDGFDSQMIKEYFQYYYLPSNNDTVGFVRLSRRIRNIFRDGHQTVITVTPTIQETTLEVTAHDGTAITEAPAYASRVFQENYPQLRYHRVASDNSDIINPQLMAYIPVKMENKAGDAIVWLKQIYILPMA